jgi:hypothetical protein
MTTIVFTHREWKKMSRRLKDEYGENIFLITWRLKRELGFTIRSHVWYDELNGRVSDIRLDFVDPAQATFFQIKYL